MAKQESVFYTHYETREVLQFYNGTPFQIIENETGNTDYVVCPYFYEHGFYGENWQGTGFNVEYPFLSCNVKLILRDPSDCNSSQKQKIKELCHKVHDTDRKIIYYADTPSSLKYGFENSIDMFNLIERGLAIDVMSLESSLKEWAINEHHKKYKNIVKERDCEFKQVLKLRSPRKTSFYYD